MTTSKKKPFILNKEKSALVIVDMQNDFVREGAALETVLARQTIEAHQKLIQYFRDNSLIVIYTKNIAGPKYTILWEWSPCMSEEEKTIWKGVKKKYKDSDKELDGSDIIDEIYPEPGDHIVEKYGYDSFYNTNLEDILKNNDIENIIVTGTVTEICVSDTVHGALHRHIKSVVAQDAVSSDTTDLHNAALKLIAKKYGRVESSDDIIRELEGK